MQSTGRKLAKKINDEVWVVSLNGYDEVDISVDGYEPECFTDTYPGREVEDFISRACEILGYTF